MLEVTGSNISKEPSNIALDAVGIRPINKELRTLIGAPFSTGDQPSI
jgi:hypothetical protein